MDICQTLLSRFLITIKTPVSVKGHGVFSRIIEDGEKTGNYKVYFASAREAFNMVSAAIDGKNGNPGDFRDYHLKSIMEESKSEVKTRKAARTEI